MRTDFGAIEDGQLEAMSPLFHNSLHDENREVVIEIMFYWCDSAIQRFSETAPRFLVSMHIRLSCNYTDNPPHTAPFVSDVLTQEISRMRIKSGKSPAPII